MKNRSNHAVEVIILVLALICAASYRNVSAQTEGLSGKPTPNQTSIMRNQDVIDLVAAGIPSSVIMAKIRNSKSAFSTDLESLKKLVAANVPEAVVSEMIEKQSKEVPASVDAGNGPSTGKLVIPMKPIWKSSTGNLFHVTVDGDQMVIERVTVFPRPKEYEVTGTAMKQGEAYFGIVRGPSWFWHTINPSTQQREIKKVCTFEDKIQVRFVDDEQITYSIEQFPDDTEFDENCKPNTKRREWKSINWKKLTQSEVEAIFATANDPSNIRFATVARPRRTLSKAEENLRYKQQAQFLFNAPTERVLTLLVRAFQSWEYQIEQESPRRLVMTKQVRGLGNQVLAGLLVGNGVEAMFKIQVSLSEVAGKTNVIINTSMGSQNLFGKVNFVSIDDQKDYRRSLDDLMEQVRWYAENPK